MSFFIPPFKNIHSSVTWTYGIPHKYMCWNFTPILIYLYITSSSKCILPHILYILNYIYICIKFSISLDYTSGNEPSFFVSVYAFYLYKTFVEYNSTSVRYVKIQVCRCMDYYYYLFIFKNIIINFTLLLLLLLLF